MREYEVALLLSPQQEDAGSIEEVREFITKNGGEILGEEDWGVRKLAYPVKNTSLVGTILYVLRHIPVPHTS